MDIVCSVNTEFMVSWPTDLVAPSYVYEMSYPLDFTILEEVVTHDILI